MSRRSNAGVVVSLAVCTLLACGGADGDEHDDNNFRDDVIECEDALAHLEGCCPGFDAKPVLCNFYYDKSTGCASSTTTSVEPAFNVQESACIRDTSCAALVERKVCERAQLARAYTRSTSSGSYSSTPSATAAPAARHAPVCP